MADDPTLAPAGPVPSPAFAGPPEPGVEFAARSFRDGPAEPRATFALGERIHWRAWFGRPAGGLRLDVVTVALERDGWERLVSGAELWLTDPTLPGYAGWLDAAAYRGPGRFALRFVRGDRLLAEGAFEVLAPPPPVVH